MKLLGIIDYINEKYTSTLGLKKHVWMDIDPTSKKYDTKELEDEFFELIQTAYAPIGGHLKIPTARDVFKSNKKWNYWRIIDIDEDPDADLLIFATKGTYGVKFAGVGHDGSKLAKRKYLDDRGDDLNKRGFYAEVSKKISEILLKKYKVPTVNDEDTVRKVLKKEIIWYGEHPTDPTTYPGKGWYSRKIGGKDEVKILVGRPKI